MIKKRKKRNLFQELMQGLEAMKLHRLGKIKLKTTKIEPQKEK